jgi:tetratricopeptide (TPR) repeat protein
MMKMRGARIGDSGFKALLPGTVLLGGITLLLFSCAGNTVDPGANARLYGSRALQLFTEGNLTGAVKDYLFNIGRVWYEAGEFDSADEALQAAYREFTYYKDSANAGTAAGFIALVYCHSGNYDRAFAWYQKGRPTELRKNSETAFWLTIQARISLLQNRVPEASAWLDRANGLAQIDYYRAAISFSQARHEDTRALLASSLALLDKTPERYRRWRVLLASATVCFCLKDTEAGERFYRRSLDCVPKGVTVPPLDSVQTCPTKFPGRQ